MHRAPLTNVEAAVLRKPGMIRPDFPPHYLPRPRLVTQLDAAMHSPITLVSAAAGWGKTAILAEWAQSRPADDRPLWLTVTPDDASHLWTSLINCLVAAAGPAARGRRPAPAWAGPGEVAELIATAPSPVVLVLDDFCTVAVPEVVAGIEYLVRHLGRRLRLVLACRSDPPLPLHRWRVSGDLGEVRTDQLAFTVTETGDLLTGYGVVPGGAALAQLHALTEGWGAGLRLAARAMHGHPEPDRVIDALGTDDLVADYLTAEVLASLPPDARRLLVDASVAEQVTPGLAEAITGRGDAGRVLADLQRRGAFVRRLEGPEDWYRLHPLLCRVLYAELRRDDTQRVPRAHLRAAGWHTAHGLPGEALRHLLASQDWAGAVAVLDRHWPDLVVGTRRRGLRDVAALPPDEVHTEPRLALAFAAERLDAADPARLRRFLRIATDLETAGGEGGGPAAPMLAAFRLAEARLNGDLQRVLEISTELGSGPDATEESRALALIAGGTARLHLARYREAIAFLLDGLALARQAGLGHAQLAAGSQLALWYAAQGRLRAAARTGRETLALAGQLGLMHMADLGWVRLALAEAHFQWDRLDEARLLAEQALDHAYGDANMLICAAVMQARIRSAADDVAGAYELMLGARREAGGSAIGPPLRRVLTLVEAELCLARGDPVGARRRLMNWHEPEPLPAFALTVEAAIALAEGKSSAAAALVAPLVEGSDPEASVSVLVQAALIAAAAGQASGDRTRVGQGLDMALEAAEEEGFRRLFVAGGHPVRDLLSTVAPGMGVYRLVVADLVEPPPQPVAAPGPHRPDLFSRYRTARRSGPPVEPLTERELTVLRYLQGTLSNVEIAGLLFVSVNTVKTHVKNIYRKLNAGHRREAVRRARELRLL
jgi:LuxR family maltose regulon positive regulatory protein